MVIIVVSCNRSPQQVQSTTRYDPETFLGTKFYALVSQLRSLPEDERDIMVKEFIATYPATPVIERDTLVSLYWYGKAEKVLVNGDLQQGWSFPDAMASVPIGENTFFYISYFVPSDARLDYQLIIDTLHTTDPGNPNITPSGYGPHSEIAMPGFKFDTIRQYRQDIPHGIIDSIMFVSQDTTIIPRQVKIYLPPGYDTLSQLPVLYVMDGIESMDYMSYTTVLDNLIAECKINPVVVVFLPPGERHTEYIGEKQPAFMTALCDEFVPFIEKKFKTSSLPEMRGITGISSGGHMALLTVLSRPDVFLYGAGQSPTISMDIYDALRSLQGEGIKLQRFRIYFDVGRFDLPGGTFLNASFLQATEDLHQKMDEAGMKHIYQVFNDGHQWANWRERTDEILVYFFAKKEI